MRPGLHLQGGIVGLVVDNRLFRAPHYDQADVRGRHELAGPEKGEEEVNNQTNDPEKNITDQEEQDPLENNIGA